MEVTTEPNATPLVRIFASRIRDAVQQADYLLLVNKCQGQFSLKAKTSPQAITIKISERAVHLDSGIQPGSDLEIHVDFDRTDDTPKVHGLLRHPLYAISVGKLLDFPVPNWADALKRFWEQYSEYPGMPTGITAKSLDEDRQLSVGSSDDAVYLEGDSADLSEVFSGSSPLAELAVKGKIKGRYRFQHVVVLSDVTLQMMLGEL